MQLLNPTARRRYGMAELCEALRTTPRTVRFYEEKGLVSPQRLGTHRTYSSQDLARLRLILTVRFAGGSLDDVRAVLTVYDQPSGAARDQEVLRVQRRQLQQLAARRDFVEASLRQLKTACAALQQRHPELRIDREMPDEDAVVRRESVLSQA